MTVDTDERPVGAQPEIIEAAARVIEGAEEESKDTDEVTLSSGLVLTVKGVAPFLIQRAAQAIPRPEVPKVFIDEKGREEENPADPRYIEALQVWEAKTIEVATNIMFAAGTEVVSIPDGMHPPESDDWLELVTLFDDTVDVSTPKRRYLTWLSLYALSSAADVRETISAVAKKTGITEGEVAAVVAGFRNRAERRALGDVPAKDA